MTIAVSGPNGYLGSAVVQTLARVNGEHLLRLGRLEQLEPNSLNCRAVIHCAGALRAQPAERIWADNVIATAKLVASARPDTTIVLSSSRAVASPQDLYGRSKSAAEKITRTHPGPVWLIRLTALAGPAPRGVGGSFLTRMAAEALSTDAINIPSQDRTVDFLDIREAAAVMTALAGISGSGSGPIDATTGPLDLGILAGLIVDSVRKRTGRVVRIKQVRLQESRHRPPAPPTVWNELRALTQVSSIPPEDTVSDTVSALVYAMEHTDEQHR